MEFKDVLKDLRIKNNLSQQELANIIFVSRSTIAKWENGLGLPCEENTNQLMKYFNVDKDYLFPVIKQEEVIEKNKKINKANKLLKMCYSIFTVIVIIVVFLLLFDGLEITYLSNYEYRDKVIIVPGYCIEVTESYVYSYKDSNGEEHKSMASSSWEEEPQNGELLWEEKFASTVKAFRNFGLLHTTLNQCKTIYLSNNVDSKNQCAGALCTIKDKRGTYHYFFDRFVGFYIYPFLYEKDITIEINGVKQDLEYGYYFKSNVNILDEDCVITVCGEVIHDKRIID